MLRDWKVQIDVMIVAYVVVYVWALMNYACLQHEESLHLELKAAKAKTTELYAIARLEELQQLIKNEWIEN